MDEIWSKKPYDEAGESMKRNILFLLLITAILAGCRQAVDPGRTPGETPRLMQEKDDALADVRDPAGIPKDLINNAMRYQIALTIPAEGLELEGTLKALYTNSEDIPLEDIYFRLPPNTSGGAIEVREVKAGGAECATELVSEGSALRVVLPKALEVGEKVEISLAFQLMVPTDMGGNYGLFGYFDGIFALDVFFPIIPVYNEQGWNVEVPSSNGDLIFTDAAFFDVTVTAPKDFSLVASGKAVDVAIENETVRTRFVGGPMRDFFLAGSRELQTISDEVDGITIRLSFPPGFETAGKYALETAKRAMTIFSERLGAYPYTEFDIIATPMLAGGMEYSGATAVSVEWYDFSKKASGTPAQSLLESVVAHELAHQWFFNQVMNNQLQEPWLDEAWAQYATYLYFLDWSGRTGAEQYLLSWQGRVQRATNQDLPIGLPAGEYTGKGDYSGIVYGKGPMFLAALAETMGQAKFDAFIREYVAMNQWKLVYSQEFLAAAENACACELDTLFAEWVYREE